ncbi:MAG: extracellular solute-binding protein [Lachnospiraceae bacterium]|jgi:ABC-type glycerol-3-phosphate transport system substrate-binding protein|nr:extracellular solute-binding protein [Lachnospiraceae bacterium]
MKPIWKRALSLLLVVAVLCSLTACGGKEDDTANAAAKEHVFRSEDLPVNADRNINNTRGITRLGDRLYMLSIAWGETGQQNFLLSTAMDGSDARIIDLEINSKRSESGGAGGMARYDGLSSVMPVVPETEAPEEDSETPDESDTPDETAPSTQDPMESESGDPSESTAEESGGDAETTPEDETAGPSDLPAVDVPVIPGGSVSYDYNLNSITSDDTNLYFLCNEYYNDYTDEKNPVYQETYYLVAVNAEGKEIWRQELGKNSNDSASYFYASSLIATPEGILCSVQNENGNGYLLFDSTGAKKDEFTLDIQDSGTFFMNGKGNLYLQYWGDKDGSWQSLVCKVDLSTKTLSDPLSIPGMASYSLNFCTNVYGGSYDCYLYDSMAVYGYNEGDADKTEILNYVDSDLDNSNMNALVILDDENMLLMQYDYEANNREGQYYISRLTKVDPADVKDKIVLKLACYGGLWNIRSRVIDFNKTNEEYRIQITDYQSYDSSGEYGAGITRLNNDIVSGNIPDILYLTSEMPISSYVSKGLLADLYPLIDKDEEMSREDFLTNILDAYSVDGKLYQMVPAFSVQTIVGKTKYVGETPGWTMTDLQNLLKTLPEGISVFSEITRENFLYTTMNLAGGLFVDWNTGKCNFNSDEFVQFLEFCNTFPEEFDYSVYEKEGYWQSYETQYREDRTLLQSLYLNSFRQYRDMKYGSFGEDITLIGFPSAPGNGSTIQTEWTMAISAQSKHPDGAWAFMRGYLLPEYQEEISYNWPLRLDQIEKLKAASKEKPFWEDPVTGEREYYEDTYWLNDQEFPLPIISDEEIQKVMDIVTTVSEVGIYDSSLMNIVTEEAAAYFSGQKSAREVADIIQSRAGIYLSENR